MPGRQEDLLVQVGFTGLEAAVYLTLLKESGLTGYRISKLAGKPVSNVYKALDSLESKGAVVSDGSGRSRLYSAMPVGVYLDHIEQEFSTNRNELETALKDVALPSVGYGVFKLENVEQVFDRAESMMESAERVVLVDCLPSPPKQCIKTLKKLAKRGIKVVIQCSDPLKIPGCQVLSTGWEKAAVPFPGAWFCIVVDANEYLVSFVSTDYTKIYEAFWSRSPFLTLLMYNGLFHEFANRQTFRQLREENSTLKDLDKFHKNLGKTYGLMVPAIKKLYSQHNLPFPDPMLQAASPSKKGKAKKSNSE